jgi:hypothetical protein
MTTPPSSSLATFATTTVRSEILGKVKALAREEAKKMLTRREQALLQDSAAAASEAELRKKGDRRAKKAEDSIKLVREAEGGTVFQSDGSKGKLPPGELLTWQHVDWAIQGVGGKGRGRKQKRNDDGKEVWADGWTVEQLKNQFRLRNAASATSSERLFKLLEEEALHVLHLGNILLAGNRKALVTRMRTVLQIEAQIEEIPESCLENEQDEAMSPDDDDLEAEIDQSSPATQHSEEVYPAQIPDHVEALLPDKQALPDNVGLTPVSDDRLIHTPRSQVPDDQVEEWMRRAGKLDPAIPTFLKEINHLSAVGVVGEPTAVASSSSAPAAPFPKQEFSSARARREVEKADQRLEFLMKAAVESVAQGRTRTVNRKSRARQKPVPGRGKYCHEMCAFDRASDGRQMRYCSNGELCPGGGWYHDACLSPYDLGLAKCKDTWICWPCHIHTTRKAIQAAHPPLEEEEEEEEEPQGDEEEDEEDKEEDEEDEDEEGTDDSDQEDEEDEEEQETDSSADEDEESKPKLRSKRQGGPPQHGENPKRRRQRGPSKGGRQ